MPPWSFCNIPSISTKAPCSAARSRIQILLKADSSPNGPAWSDSTNANALDVVPSTVASVCRRYLEQGLASAPVRRYTDHNPGAVTSEVEAHLIALSRSAPPEGREHWTSQLRANKLVEVKQVLAIPDYMKVSFAVRLGYALPTSFKYVRVHREVESFTHHNRYATKPGVPEPARDEKMPD